MVDAQSLARSITTSYPDIIPRFSEGNRIELVVPSSRIHDVITIINEHIVDALPESCFGVDLGNDKYEVIYIIWSHDSKLLCQIRVTLEGETPAIESVSDIFPGFEWHEREISEMFGIIFKNHPDMRPLLLPEELVGKYPMRKRFVTDRRRVDETGLSAQPKPSSGGDSS